MGGIYKIQSGIYPERLYIGSAINIKDRWRRHLSCLKRDCHSNIKLQHHYNKYGESDLQFSILLGCNKEDLIAHEQYFIDSYKPWFNICPKAGSCLGTHQSDEARMKNRISNLGKRHSLESIEKIRLAKLGKKRGAMSNEQKDKISKTLKTKTVGSDNPFYGKHHSIETRRSASVRMKGENNPMFGKHHSEEIKNKIAKINTGNTYNKGKKMNEEGRLKVKLSWEKRRHKIAS